MKLKISNSTMSGSTATVEINGAVAKDVTRVEVVLDACRPSTATVTYLVEELDLDVDIDDAQWHQ